MLDILKAIIFGIVEGITEWLPISSTGHLILVQEFLRFDQNKSFIELFNVMIQLGAIFAVVVLYFDKLFPFVKDRSRPMIDRSIRLWVRIVIGCIPACVGILLNDFIEAKFNNALVVSVMLIVYGILFIVIENRNMGVKPSIRSIGQMPVQVVLLIGVFQMLAMIPGTSRSGATIVGGLLLGCARSVAAEFTFFMGVPVMAGASLIKLIHHGSAVTLIQCLYLLVGMFVSFFVSVFAIKFLMKYIKRHDFKVFGYYRIILGAIVLLYFIIGLFL